MPDLFDELDPDERERLERQQEREIAERQVKVLSAARACLDNVNGKVLLDHLAEVSHYSNTSYVEKDPHTTIFNEGKRGLYLYLTRLVEDSRNEEFLNNLLKATEVAEDKS